jgi:hypothetical protein
MGGLIWSESGAAGWVVIAAGGFAGGFICGVIACMGM